MCFWLCKEKYVTYLKSLEQIENIPDEVDFVIQHENILIPIETKAGASVKSTSLKNYAKKYGESTPLMIRFSLKNLSLDGGTLNIPLFMIDEVERLIKIAMVK